MRASSEDAWRGSEVPDACATGRPTCPTRAGAALQARRNARDGAERRDATHPDDRATRPSRAPGTHGWQKDLRPEATVGEQDATEHGVGAVGRGRARAKPTYSPGRSTTPRQVGKMGERPEPGASRAFRVGSTTA